MGETAVPIGFLCDVAPPSLAPLQAWDAPKLLAPLGGQKAVLA